MRLALVVLSTTEKALTWGLRDAGLRDGVPLLHMCDPLLLYLLSDRLSFQPTYLSTLPPLKGQGPRPGPYDGTKEVRHVMRSLEDYSGIMNDKTNSDKLKSKTLDINFCTIFTSKGQRSAGGP